VVAIHSPALSSLTFFSGTRTQLVNKETETKYLFSEFELDPVRRMLSRAGQPIALKPKVFETLLVLVRDKQTLHRPRGVTII
jgi:DNA-binding response OmpR family regulator